MINYEIIKNEIKGLLNEGRYQHVLNVEKEAVRLGTLYGVDIEKCRIAGIAHDCVKNYSGEQLLSLAQEYGIEVDYIQLNSLQLLHGPVGAAYCKDKFEIEDEDILNAICYHTTGRGEMSLLEKIIYLSDITEEGRDFEGVDELRRLSNINIDEAILMSCNKTIVYIINRDLTIHPLTIELRNNLLLGR